MDQGNVNAMKNSLSDIEYYMWKCSELKSTIAQKDTEIERLREVLKKVVDFDVNQYLRYENAIKFMKDNAKQALEEVTDETTNG